MVRPLSTCAFVVAVVCAVSAASSALADPPTSPDAEVAEVGDGLKIKGTIVDRRENIHRVRFVAGKTYAIDMWSPDTKALDPLLRLFSPDSKLLAEDDDGGGLFNARITFDAKVDGAYAIAATTFGQGAGPYRISIREVEKSEMSAAERNRLIAQMLRVSNEANALHRANRLADAEAALVKAVGLGRVAFSKGTYPDGQHDLRNILGNLGIVKEKLGKLEEAEALIRESYDMERRLVEGDDAIARGLAEAIGRVLSPQGKYAESEAFLRKAYEMHLRLVKGDQPLTAAFLRNLSLVLEHQGKFEEAESTFREALNMRRRLAGQADSPLVYEHLTWFSEILAKVGKFAEAETRIREALEMQKRMQPGDSNKATHCLSKLGYILREARRYSESEKVVREALQMRERLHPNDVANAAVERTNLASILKMQHKQAEAELEARGTLAAMRSVSPKEKYPNGDLPLAALIELAADLIEWREDNIAEVDGLFREALAMRRALVSWDDDGTFRSMIAYGDYLRWQRKYDQAVKMDRDALAMIRRMYKEPSPHLVGCLAGLSESLRHQGNHEEAFRCTKEAMQVERVLSMNYVENRSFGEALMFHATTARTLGYLLTNAKQLDADPAMVYAEIWSNKAILSRAVERRQRELRAVAADPDAAKSISQLSLLRRWRADRIVSPDPRDPGKRTQRDNEIRDMTEKIDRLERRIREIAPAGDRAERISVAGPSDLQKALPTDAVVIDFQRYEHRHRDPKDGGDGKYFSYRYLAFVISSEKIDWVDLGPAEPIEKAVTDWRQAITNAKAIDDRLANQVRALAWENVRKRIPSGTKTVYMAPDFDFCRLPWPALPGDRPGTILLEDYAIAVVPHTALLLQNLWPQEASPKRGLGVVAVGGVRYDEPIEKSGRSADVRGPLVREGAKVLWKDLPGTAAEAKGVAEAARKKNLETRVIVGRSATVAAVLESLPGARYAHLSTHGFFADPSFRSVFQLDQKLFETTSYGERLGAGSLNPLVMSGLVFAGANRPETPGRGILTGEALIDLDLSGLDLTVLSACETGLGDVAGGEGTLGLQRAFHFAGARNVVASLWKVDDDATAALMSVFYRELWQNDQPPIEALRRAQLEIYRNPGRIPELAKAGRGGFEEVAGDAPTSLTAPDAHGRAHPRQWAAFTLSGTGKLSASGPPALVREKGQLLVAQKEPAPKGPAEAELTIGKEGLKLQGRVAATDPKVTATIGPNRTGPMPGKQYLVKLEAGKRYAIAMSSKAIDSFLVVHDSRGKQVAFDDDSGGGLDAALDLDVTEGGVYRIHAASFQGLGDFTLRVSVVDDNPTELTVGKEGVTVTGKLAGSEPKVNVVMAGRQSQMPAKQYLVKLEAGKHYDIAMSSGALDSFLVVQDSKGKQLAFDDDSGGGLDAALRFTPPESGSYRIYAAAFNGAGAYTFRVSEVAGEKAGTSIVGKDGLKLEGTVSALDRAVNVMARPNQIVTVRARRFLVKMEAGKRYDMTLSSLTMDSMLVVLDPTGKQLAIDDDSGGALDASLEFQAPRDGDYPVLAAAYKGNGPFVLEVRELKGPGKLTPERRKELTAKAAELEAAYSAATAKRDFVEAGRCMLDAIDIVKELYPEEDYPDGHPLIAGRLRNLAVAIKAQGRLGAAEPYRREVLAINKRVHKTDHLDSAEASNSLGLLLKEEGKLTDAAPFLRDALAMWMRIHKGDHPNVNTGLNNMGLLLRAQQRPEEAERYFRDSLAMYRRNIRGDHPMLALGLDHLGTALFEESKLDQAEPLLREALQMRRRLFKGDHADLAESIRNMGLVLDAQNKLESAEPLLRESLAMRKRLYKGDHIEIAADLGSIAMLLRRQKKLQEAERLLREEFEMRQRLDPEDRPDTAKALVNLGFVIGHQERFPEAEPLARQCLAMLQRLHKGDHEDTLECISLLGLTLKKQGKLKEAEPVLRDALAMSRRLFEGDHRTTAANLNNLAGVLRAQEKLAEAESLFRESLAMSERSRAGDQPEVAQCLGNFVGLLTQQGKLAEAEKFGRQSLAMARRLYGADNPELAFPLNNLGYVLWLDDQPEQAEKFFRESLSIRQRFYKGDHYLITTNLNNLALALIDQGKLAEAESIARQGLAMQERIGLKEEGVLRAGRSTLGLALLRQDKPAEAEPLFRDALERIRRQVGADHPSAAGIMGNLCTSLRDQGKLAEAEAVSREELRMFRRLVERYADAESDGNALTYLSNLPMCRDGFLTITRMASSDPVATYEEVWNAKAILARVYERRALAARTARTANPKAAALLSDLVEARRRRAERLLAPRANDVAGQKRRDLDLAALDTRIAELDGKLRPLLPALERSEKLAQAKPIDLQKRLPHDVAVVDLQKYVDFAKKTVGPDGERSFERHYLAFVVTADSIKRVELGLAGPIEESIRDWNAAIRTPGKDIPAELPRAVRELAWDKIRRELPASVKTVYLATDMAMALVPWAALPGDREGTILLEDYALAVIPHAPFLLDRLTPEKSASDIPNRLLAVGGVAFDDAPARPAKRNENSVGAMAAPPDSERKLKWNLLPGTESEAKGLQALATRRKLDCALLSGSEASTSAVLDELSRARFAHLATHGFFADPKLRSVLHVDSRLFEMHGQERVGAGAQSPMLLSGLVFAGANRPDTAGRGLLVGEALVDRDLSGLDLAVLSACETGLGDVTRGEGVFGLQRAFHLAGARNVVASLWKVEDSATAALMAIFYRELWENDQPPIEALRRAQLEIYRNPGKIAELAKGWRGGFEVVPGDTADAPPSADKSGHAPPRQWAAFTLSGPGTLSASGPVRAPKLPGK
jgi:CHAT domain-containing protein/Tfp pilus assembly protein PilF